MMGTVDNRIAMLLFAVVSASRFGYNSGEQLESLKLTGGTIVTPAFSSTNCSKSKEVRIKLSDKDFNALQRLEHLGTRRNDTYVSMEAGTVSDIFSNPSMEVPLSPGFRVSSLVSDETGPQLQSFSLDMENGRLLLMFSETVNVTSIDIISGALTLQSESNLSAPGVEFVELSGERENASRYDDAVIEILLTTADMNRIKVLTKLGSGLLNTFLSLNNNFIEDQQGVSIIAVSRENATNAAAFTGDSSGPQLLYFSVNLNDRTLILEFDEAVDATSLNAGSIVLRGASSPTSSGVFVDITDASMVNGVSITINITKDNINSINRDPLLCTQPDGSNCFLHASFGAVVDLAPVAKPSAAAILRAAAFVEDKTSPTLEKFVLSIDTGSFLDLYFDEVVDVSSIAVSGIKLQSTVSSDSVHEVSLGQAVLASNSLDDTFVRLRLDVSTTNSFKAKTFCLGSDSCYLSINQQVIRDVSQNPIRPINDTNALMAETVNRDTTDIVFTTFVSVNYNTAIITLEFNEPFNPSSVNASALQLHASDPSTVIDTNIRLTEGDTSSPYGLSMQLNIFKTDLNRLKIVDVCTKVNGAGCFISLDRTFVTDVFGNPLADQSVFPFAQAVILDSVGPTIVSFDIDLTSPSLTIVYDEPVRVSEMATTALTIQAAANISTSVVGVVTISATNALANADVSTLASFPLSAEDLFRLQANTDIATGVADTYLVVADFLVRDVAGNGGNKNQAIPSDVALQVSSYIEDGIPPRLTGFLEANLATGGMVFETSEPVLAESFDITALTFQSNIDGGSTFHPHDRTVATYVDSSAKDRLRVMLSSDDLERLQSNLQVFSAKSSTFALPANASFNDTAGNPSVQLSQNAFLVGVYLAQDRPSVVRFTLDLNREVMTIVFDSAIDGSSLVLGSVVVQSTRAATAAGSQALSLTNASYTNVTTGFSLFIFLGEADLNAMKQDAALAIDNRSTYLALAPDALNDVYGSPIVGEVASNAYPVDAYIPDAQAPFVRTFAWDLEAGVLVVHVNEVVQLGTINASHVALINTATRTPASTLVWLTATHVTAGAMHNTFNLTVGAEDLNAIKNATDLGVAVDNTYLVVEHEAFADVAGNRVHNPAPVAADMVTSDITPPSLVSCALDMNEHTLRLTFSEHVLAESLVDISKIGVASSSLGANRFALTGGDAINIDPITLQVVLTTTDVNAIKGQYNLATTQDTTFVTLDSDAVTDAQGNGNVGVAPSAAMQVATYAPDTTGPRVLGAEIDMNAGVVTLTFDETVDDASFDATAVVARASNESNATWYRLSPTSTTLVASANNTDVVFRLSYADEQVIKALRDVWVDAASAFISVDSTVVRDAVGLAPLTSLLPGVFQAHRYVVDSTAPNITHFYVNMNASTVVVRFSEVASDNSSDFHADRLVLQSTADDTGVHVQLQGAASVDFAPNYLMVQVQLLPTDVDRIHALDGLYTTETNTYLSTDGSVFADAAGVAAIGIDAANALPVDVFVGDETRPEVLAFHINMSTGELWVEFSEVMDASSLNASALTLQSVATATVPSEAHSLTGVAVAPAQDGKELRVVLSIADLNALKVYRIALSETTSFLTVAAGGVTDMHGLPVNARRNGYNAVPVGMYTGDTVAPQLDTAQLSIHAGVLTLFFSETIAMHSLETAGIAIQSTDAVEKYCPCQACLNSEYRVAECTGTTDTVCAPCQECAIGQYETTPCAATNNSACAACAACPADAYMVAWCSGTTPTRCEPCNSDVPFCAACTGPGALCTACTNGHVLHAGTCVVSCPLGYYASADNTCEPCDASCRNCVGPGDLCTECEGDMIVNPLFAPNPGPCTDVCFPVRKFKVGAECQDCALTCGDCFGGGATDCITCPVGKFLFERRECVDACGQGYFARPVVKESVFQVNACVPCSAGCVSCSSADVCDACDGALVLDNGRCHFNTVAAENATLYAPGADPQVTYPVGTSTRGNTTCVWQRMVDGVTLSNSSLSASADGPVVVVELSSHDLNRLKAAVVVGVSRNTSYITLTNTTVADVNGNNVVPLTGSPHCPEPCFQRCVCPLDNLHVAVFEPDVNPPELVSMTMTFSLSAQNTATLGLCFNESIVPASINTSSLRVHNVDVSAAVRISQAVITMHGLTCFTMELHENDVSAIKLQPTLAVSRNSTYVSFDAAFLLDFNGNAVVPVAGFRATTFVADAVGPQLASVYAFNLDAEGSLVLEFYEPVDIATFQPQHVTIQNTASADNATYVRALHANSTIARVNGSATMVRVGLTRADMNAWKAAVDAVVSADTTFVALTADALRDMQGIRIVAVSPGAAMQTLLFVNDTTAPQLRAFSVDFRGNRGQLHLHFSEVVMATELDSTQLTLLPRANGSEGDGYALTALPAANATTTCIHAPHMCYTDVVTVDLTTTGDLDAIKKQPALFVDLASAFLAVNPGAIVDMMGNAVERIALTHAMPAADFYADDTAVAVTAFTLNMHVGTITLQLSETVDIYSLDVARLALQSNVTNVGGGGGGDAFRSVRLVRGSSGFLYAAPYDTRVAIQIGEDELNELKRLDGLATDATNTFLTVDPRFGTDMNNNSFVSISVANALSPADFTPDTKAPQIRECAFNLNNATLVCVFSETMRASLTNVSKISLANNSTAVTFVSLFDAAVVSPDGPELELALSNAEANRLKAAEGLATDASNTYVVVQQGAFTDMNDNVIVAHGMGQGVRVDRFVNDTTAPVLLRYALTMPSQKPPIQIDMYFSETLAMSSFNLAAVAPTFTNRNGTNALTLTNGTVARDMSDSSIVHLVMSNNDYLAIIALDPQVAHTPADTRLSFGAVLATDTSGNPVVPVAHVPVDVESYSVDIIRPYLASFDIDFEVPANSSITLYFSEAVVLPMVVRSITLQKFATLSAETVTLSGSAFVDQRNASTITVGLLSGDVDNIRRMDDLASARATTYVSLQPNAIHDLAENWARGISEESAMLVSEYRGDDTPPQLVTYDLNAETGLLVFTFDEVIDHTTFDVGALSFQGVASGGNTLAVVAVSGLNGTVSSADDSIVRVTLDLASMNALRSIPTIAVSPETTYVAFTALAEDLAHNAVMDVSTANALRVENYTFDRAPPVPLAFTIDMSIGRVALEFDQPVNTSTFDATRVTFTNANGNSTVSHTLQGAVLVHPQTPLVTVLQFDFLKTDRDTFYSTDLCDKYHQESGCFLHFNESVILDTSGVPVDRVAPGDSVAAREYHTDTVRPTVDLRGFQSIDMNTGVLHIRFTEPVDFGVFDAAKLRLTNMFEQSTASLGISGALAINTAYTTVLAVQLSNATLNAIKLDATLCVQGTSCYIVMGAGATTDMAENPNIATTDMAVSHPTFLPFSFAQRFIPDTTAPACIGFSIDVDAHTLTLVFDEVVRTSTFNTSDVVLVSGLPNTSTQRHRLVSSDVLTQTDGDTVTVALSDADMNAIKVAYPLAQTRETTFLAFTQRLVKDLAAVPVAVTPINANAPLALTGNYTPDVTPPMLVSFQLDLDTERVTLLFTEPLFASTVNMSKATLHATADGTGTRVSVTAATLVDTPAIAATLHLRLGEAAMVLLKGNPAIATSATNAFIALDYGFAQDTAGLDTVEVSATQPQQADIFGDDTTAAMLGNYSVNMGTREITLQFDEIMDPTTFDTTGVQVQNAPLQANATAYYRLTSSVVTSPLGSTVVIRLSDTDLAGITSNPTLARSAAQMYLRFTAYTIDDFRGRDVVAVTDGKAAAPFAFIPDTDPIDLVLAVLNMSQGTLMLRFDEPLNATTFNLEALTMVSSSDAQATTVQTHAFRYHASENATCNVCQSSVSFDDPLGQTAVIVINDADLDAIKIATELAVSAATVWFDFNSELVVDHHTNAIAPLAHTEVDRQPEVEFYEDLVRPQLKRFAINMDVGTLSLEFTEAMNVSSIVVGEMFLRHDGAHASQDVSDP